MALSRRNGRPRATLIFLILLSITAITLDFRGDGGGIVGSARDFASDVFSPVRDAAARALDPIGDGLQGVTGYGSLEDENERLRRELAEQEGEAATAESDKAELARLQGLLGLQDELGAHRFLAARVVSVRPNNFEETIELNRGSSDGVKVDMPVVDGAGLVGRVVEVSGSRSTVRLINDPDSSVGVRFVNSGEIGTADGEGPGRDLSVGLVARGAALGDDELAVTAGQDFGSTIYPPGIPVGRVASTSKVDGELGQRVVLEPIADLGRLSYVSILLGPKS